MDQSWPKSKGGDLIKQPKEPLLIGGFRYKIISSNCPHTVSYQDNIKTRPHYTWYKKFKKKDHTIPMVNELITFWLMPGSIFQYKMIMDAEKQVYTRVQSIINSQCHGTF